MSTSVVGVDPGGTTGICIWNRAVGISLREVEGAEHAVDWLASMANAMHGTVFVVERYIITPATAKMSQQHDALEIIGALKYLVRQHDHHLVLQTPAAAKGFATDEKLKRAGWYKPGMGHARDASRHVLTYLAGQGIIDLATLLPDGMMEVHTT